MARSLQIKIEIIRLPDINDYRHLPAEYDDYGRFGVTRSEFFYVLGIRSSHDRQTCIGGYWAVSHARDVLYLSPRGAALGFEEFVAELVRDGRIAEIGR